MYNTQIYQGEEVREYRLTNSASWLHFRKNWLPQYLDTCKKTRFIEQSCWLNFSEYFLCWESAKTNALGYFFHFFNTFLIVLFPLEHSLKDVILGCHKPITGDETHQIFLRQLEEWWGFQYLTSVSLSEFEALLLHVRQVVYVTVHKESEKSVFRHILCSMFS